MACLLEQLCNENGVSGNEHKIRAIVINEISPYVDDITVDTMGNIIAHKCGKSEKKLMVAAHMDEPGYIVSEITETGYLKFKSVGRIDPRVIVSKKVLIGDSKVKGVIGMKAVHLQKKTERENVVNISDLFIDIGAKNKKDAQSYVSAGDYIAFDTEFADLGKIIKGKALDSRIGCACLIELLKQDLESDIYAVFAVQSEIEGRGAGVAAYSVNPDFAVIIDTVEAADMFGTQPHEKAAVLGNGAVVSYMDRRAIFDRQATDKIAGLAEEHGIKTQQKNSAEGSYDSKAVQTARDGAVTVNIAIPCRYSHTPVCMASKQDIDAVSELTALILKSGGEI